MRRTRITGVHPCDANNQVVTIATSGDGPFVYRREPCAECPWRKDRPKRAFPAEAFRHSASTAYDMAMNTFACHMAGQSNPATCAGFILSRDAAHNLMLRMKGAGDQFRWDNVSAAGLKLYPSYRAMAIANGVSRNDPVLAPCRSDA
jgi:Family of unknown function (DUF6283)